MSSIEQAREALAPFAAMADELANEPSWKGVLEHDHPLAGRVNVSDFRRAADALASLSPSTPVDGVGAEPTDDDLIRRGDVFAVVQMMLEQFDATENDDLRGGLHVMIADIPALASPEAEARLRERVAELEEERDDLLDKLDKRIAMHHETEEQLDRVKAEARLAQAEGGPAVTDFRAALQNIHREIERVHAKFESVDRSDLRYFMILIEAALHSQSTAGMAESGGVLSTGWVKDALHSNGADVAAKIAARIRAEARLAQAEGGPAVTEARWEAIDEKGDDNFATSIYEAGYDGLLVARCNQNGSHPWQGPAIIRGLEANKAALHPQSAAGEEGKP